ncbi:MAG: hypothetical protein M0Z53_07765 [Thermaerobacter sp.]|nr:hypothetical protein [Thermaerobacter sp.]
MPTRGEGSLRLLPLCVNQAVPDTPDTGRRAAMGYDTGPRGGLDRLIAAYPADL